MFPVIALTGATGTGKTYIAHEVARNTGAIVLPMDQLQRYKYLQEGVGLDPVSLNQVKHAGYQMLSPWKVSGPKKYADWLGDTIRCFRLRQPIVIEGGCTSYLLHLLERQEKNEIFQNIHFFGIVTTENDDSLIFDKIKTLYSCAKLERISNEIQSLENLGFISPTGLSFLQECENLFKHPEHSDKRLAWALRISAKVYCPAYLVLKQRITKKDAQNRLVKNIYDIHQYQNNRIRTALPIENQVEWSNSFRLVSMMREIIQRH